MLNTLFIQNIPAFVLKLYYVFSLSVVVMIFGEPRVSEVVLEYQSSLQRCYLGFKQALVKISSGASCETFPGCPIEIVNNIIYF